MEYKLLESVSRKTLLGIRFWDPVLNTQIEDGLCVSLCASENKENKIRANKTKSGVYAFNNIPGMIDFETLTNDEDASGSPSETKAYLLEIEDDRKRFVNVALALDLPLSYSGLFLVDNNSGSPANQLRGFNLYSSVTRERAPQFAFVRGDLLDKTTDEPAKNALIKVQTEEEYTWYGISDEDGKFAVMMPYPLLDISFGASPPNSSGIHLSERSWDVSVTVMYDPMGQTDFSGSDLPDYLSILNQGQAFIYTHTPENEDGEVLEMQAELLYGRDLIVKTAGFSELYVNPTGSPA